MSPRLALFAVLGGCFVDHTGTAVGNPTMDAQLARVAGGNVDSAILPVARVEFTACSDGTVTTATPGTLDLLARDAIAMPDGAVCNIDVIPSDRLEVTGTTAGGHSFRVRMETAGIRLSPVSASPGAYVLEFGTPDFVDVSGAVDDVLIERGVPGYDAVLLAVETGSGLYVDGDQNGRVSDTERAQGPVATASPLGASAPDSDDPTDTDTDPAPDTDTDTGTHTDTSTDTDTSAP